MLQPDKPPFNVIHLKTLLYTVQGNIQWTCYLENGSIMYTAHSSNNYRHDRLCNTSLQYQNTVSEWNLVHREKHALCGEFPRTSDSGAPSRAMRRSIPLRDIAQRLSVLHYLVKQARNDLKHTLTLERKLSFPFARNETLKHHFHINFSHVEISANIPSIASVHIDIYINVFTNCNSASTKTIK